ncbi:MAG: hypothetical protein MJE68_12870 [Proteobacteria bacterium]|nr:hypothetical protein [Pseudomonadota bacterium]
MTSHSLIGPLRATSYTPPLHNLSFHQKQPPSKKPPASRGKGGQPVGKAERGGRQALY